MPRLGQRTPPIDRAFAKIKMPSNFFECWIWEGYTNKDGYGQFYDGEQNGARVHKWLYENSIGPVPKGLELHHKCFVTKCVNPIHLEPTTHTKNIAESPCVSTINKAKTHCPKGHEYTWENTYVEPNRGVRRCRTCRGYRQLVKGRDNGARSSLSC